MKKILQLQKIFHQLLGKYFSNYLKIFHRLVGNSLPFISENISPTEKYFVVLRFSNSSSETKANTLSSLSAGEDLDGSDSLPEYHANYIKSGQPDLVSSAGSENIKAYNYNNRSVCSTLIGPDPTLLRSHWSRAS